MTHQGQNMNSKSVKPKHQTVIMKTMEETLHNIINVKLVKHKCAHHVYSCRHMFAKCPVLTLNLVGIM